MDSDENATAVVSDRAAPLMESTEIRSSGPSIRSAPPVGDPPRQQISEPDNHTASEVDLFAGVVETVSTTDTIAEQQPNTVSFDPYQARTSAPAIGELTTSPLTTLIAPARALWRMATVWDVAKEAKTGDRIKWVGENSEVTNPEASTVTRVLRDEGKITVEADGPGGADVSFWVKRDGTSEVLYQGTEQGAIDGVELPDKGIGTRHFQR